MAPECGASSPDSDELLVAQILLHFPLLAHKSQLKSISSLGLSPAWGRTRKRSASNSASPSTSSPPPKDLSPTGPLLLNSSSLSPSESDDNTKRSIKKPSLNKKTEYLGAIDELTKRKRVLEGEIEAVKRHYNHLKTINSELKAKKQKMMPSFYNGSPQPETGSSSSAMEIAQLTVKSSSPTLENHHHQHQQQQKQNHNRHRHYPQPSIKNQTPEPSQSFQIPPYDTSLGPIGIPDLNISLEEFAQRNYSKIKAAQARQRRIRICKTKNSNAAIKLQSPNPCSGRASDSI